MKSKPENTKKTPVVPLPPKPPQPPAFDRNKMGFKPSARFGTINRGRR